MVICLERGADLHIAQLMPLPLTVSCFSKVQIGFTFLVPAHLGSPGKGPLNRCVCVCVSRFSEIAKSAAGEAGKAAQTRALLFDMTFIMLVHIIQLYGLEVPPSTSH